MNLLDLTYDQLEEEFRCRYGRGKFHAAALYRAFYQSSKLDLEHLPEFAASPALLDQVRRDLDDTDPTIVRKDLHQGVTKLVFELADGHTIETVIIPMANHATVCVSSQVGCRMGCRFCRTGAMRWQRNLTPDEIVGQVHAVRRQLGVKVRNVVFMGMGEPLDNFDHVIHAITIMEDQRGLDIAKRHMTLSTVGLPHAIGALGHLNWGRLRLAISLNAPNDAIRNELMPVNRRYPMQHLKAALQHYPLGKGESLFVEYVLIRGVNDQTEHARELVQYLDGLPVKLNLIPYNPGGHASFKVPTRSDVDRFHRALVDMRLFVRLRSSKGAAIRAACGQLGGH